MDPKEIIADIRRRLLVDVDLPPELREGIDELKEQLNNALDHLSRDLYSSDAHFVLELIQNADDNEYENEAEPWLKFEIDDKAVLLENNELGFASDNVRSLCRVGASTKKKRDGFIGEKGLGFKSVFKVSDEPHIFSNGFSFKFKIEQSKDGYVVPHWVENPPVPHSENTTTIYLPLRSGIDVAPYFETITPTLILFLQKLRRLEIHIREHGGTREISKSRHDGITTLLDSTTADPSRYLVTFRAVAVPDGISEQSRAGITLREIVLAFPLNLAGTAAASEQTLFAFLPVRPYGFKFIIQGDFLLAANREDVRKDSKWNEWLRNEVAQTFCRSLEQFKAHEQLRSTYLQYIPLPGEISDSFFTEVVPQIHSQLAESECLLSVPGKWSLPSKLLRSSTDIREIIPNEELKRLTGFEYLSPEHASAPPTVLNALGCKVILLEHVHTCLADDSWFHSRPLQWYQILFRWMSRRFKKDDEIEELRKFKILPLANGDVVCLNDGQVFFTAELKTNYGFETSLRMLNPELLSGLEKDEAGELRAFLERLGVKAPSAYQVIDACILPLYRFDDFATLPKAELRDHVRYIKQHLPEYRKACTIVQESVADNLSVLRLEADSPGEAKPNYKPATELYLPPAYRPLLNAADMFAGLSAAAFVSSAYIKPQSASAEDILSIESWRSFLLEIAVNEYPRIVYTKTFRQTWAPDTHRFGYQVEDWEFADEVSAALSKPETCAKVVEAIDAGWNRVYAGKRQLITGSHYSRTWQEPLEPSFLTHLRKTHFQTSLGTLLPLSECLLDTASLRNSFGTLLPFVSLRLRCPEFISALGIPHELDLDFALRQIRRIRDTNSVDIALARKLYRVVEVTAEACMDQVGQTFSEERLILVSADESVFASSGEICWSSYPAPLDKRKLSIGRLYPELGSFFLEHIKIPKELDARDLAVALEEICDKDGLSSEESELVIAIYHELSKWIDRNVKDGAEIEPWFDEFIKKPVFWTTRGFWRNDEDIFVNDDPELCQHFDNEEEIAFLRVPASHNSRLEPFIKRSGLQFASKVVSVRPTTSDAELDRRWTRLLRKAIMHVARYLHARQYQDFKRLAESGTFSQLSRFECLFVEPLTVEYELRGTRVTARRQVLLDENRVWVDRELCNSDMIAAEFSQLFGTSDGVAMFVSLLLDKLGTNRPVDSLFDSLKIPPLSEADSAFLRSALAGSDVEWTGEIEVPKEVLSGISSASSALTHSSVTGNSETHVPAEVPPESTIGSSSHQSETDAQNATPPGRDDHLIQTDAASAGGSEAGPADSVAGSWVPVCAPANASSGSTREFEPRTNTVNLRVNESIFQVQRWTTSKSSTETSDFAAAARGKDGQEIGNWGEEWVVEKYLPAMLQQELKDTVVRHSPSGFELLTSGVVVVRATWLNCTCEQYLPYDIRVERQSRPDLFVEVKSTSHAEKDWFEISRNEWDLAAAERENYCIYRVYSCGSASPEAMIIDDPYGRWQRAELEANPVRLCL